MAAGNKKSKKSIEAQNAEKLNSRIIELLVDERKKSGMTMEEMGEKMGKLKSSIHRFEKGKYNLTLEKFLEICNILQVKPEEIIRRANN
jgi:transcriptional regulator with XRE-family HTH domain